MSALLLGKSVKESGSLDREENFGKNGLTTLVLNFPADRRGCSECGEERRAEN
jgi:hypothetical protein